MSLNLGCGKAIVNESRTETSSRASRNAVTAVVPTGHTSRGIWGRKRRVEQNSGPEYETFRGKVRAFVATPSAKGSTAN
jgi:hypothetical protein